MNGFIFLLLVVVVALFHLVMRTFMRRGNVKTGFCAIWCMDTIFAVCGTVLSYMMYHYEFYSYLTVRNVVLALVYLLITFIFIWLAPSGLSLLWRKKGLGSEDVLLAEYRLNDTLGMVRNCFLIMLAALPVLFSLVQVSKFIFHFVAWEEDKLYGGFCFAAFLILVPICLRQALFWLRNLTDSDMVTEKTAMRKYRMELCYRRWNWLL